MTIEEQILFISKLPNSGQKYQVINSLKILQKHLKGTMGDFCIVTMSVEDYKQFEQFKKFQDFIKK